jgi:hypothetical protein
MTTLINFEDYWSEENRNVVVPVDLIPVPEGPRKVPKTNRNPKLESGKEGLWFRYWDGVWYWSAAIPQEHSYIIYYDERVLGRQADNFELSIFDNGEPYLVKVKERFAHYGNRYDVGRVLTLDDFDIIPNPDYQE